jgi:hypothetical protein
LGRERHSERQGDGAWQAPAAYPHGYEQDQAAGREDGQDEAEAACQPGVDGEQADGRGGQGGGAGTAAGEEDADEGDAAHHGCAQDAGFRPGEDDEAGDGECCARGTDPPVGTREGQAAGDGGGDDGAVGSADRGEVGEAGGLEVGAQVGGEPGGVADDEGRQEAGGVRGQAGARRPEAGAQPFRGAPRPGTRVHHDRRALSGDGRDGGLTGVGRQEASGEADVRTGHRRRPRRSAQDEDRPRDGVLGAAARRHLAGVDADCPAATRLVGARGDGAGVTSDAAHDRRDRAVGGPVLKGAGVACGEAGRGRGEHEHDGGARQGCAGDPAVPGGRWRRVAGARGG